MFIYNGKFTWSDYALNEAITVVFPAGFALNDPVSAYWQWSTDALVNKKASVSSSGVVNSVTTTADGYSRIHVSFGYYTFDATVSPDNKMLTLTMRGSNGTTSEPSKLASMHIDTTLNTHQTDVFTGMLEWRSNATKEMTTLIVPYGVTEGAFFGLYHQWTVDPLTGSSKTNARVNGVFQNVIKGAGERVTASFKAGYYAYSFKFNGKDGSFVLSDPTTGEESEENKFALMITSKV